MKGRLGESEDAKEKLEVELAESNTHSDRIRQDNDKMLELLAETESDCQNTARLIEKLEKDRTLLRDRLVHYLMGDYQLYVSIKIIRSLISIPLIRLFIY